MLLDWGFDWNARIILIDFGRLNLYPRLISSANFFAITLRGGSEWYFSFAGPRSNRAAFA